MAEEVDTNVLAKRLELAMTELNRKFDAGTIMKMSDDVQPWPSMTTGIYALDIALGIGGYPKDRIIEIFGPESSGKSTLALQAVANFQADGGTCLYVDAEHALDPIYARNLGVKLDDLILSQPGYGEEAMDIVETMTRTGAVDLIVVDSVAALTPKAELEGDFSDSHMGQQARMMARGMRKLPSLCRDGGTTIIFINQIRMKLGVMFGNPETQPGGRALPYAASARIDLRKIENLTDKSGDNVGSRVKAKVVKNKMAPPLKQVEFDIQYGRGANSLKSIVEVAVEYGVVKRSGAWYSYDGEQLGQGLDKAVEALSDIDLSNEIKKKIDEIRLG